MKKLWITYAWKDNNDGDFDYLVQELNKVGIDAQFDRVALIPGQRLWEQLGEKIMNGNFDGWAYLITPTSLSSQPCREELEYAVTRALHAKSSKFPLIGLIHGVSFDHVPASLKVRLCVSLGSQNWTEEIKAGLELRPPIILGESQTKFIYKTVEIGNGTGKFTIIEIRPRFGEIMHWKVFIPSSTPVSKWGFGPADGNDNISGIMTNVVSGINLNLNGIAVTGFGSGDRLSPSVAAKIIFKNDIPEFVAFGISKASLDIPTEVEVYKLK